MNLREAAQQALELWDAECDLDNVMEALRTALAEPEQEPVARRLIREDFEQRMRAAGYTPTELQRLDSGIYFSPAVHAEWEAEKRKYTSPVPDDTTLLREDVRRLTEENSLLDNRLEEAVEDMKALLKAAPWKKCRTHGPAHPSEWACPSCLRELRSDNDKFRAHIENQTKELDQLIPMAEKLEAQADHDTALLRQALEALEGWANYGKWVWPESALEQAKRNTEEAITALRKRLGGKT